ncbi:T9SS type B sorting domain-containing protein [Allomuricauda sp. SCSIO 65647]|uniref:T9SS type B sorting domain-containing protein n=1 Tax=Allomuricauda sp. SCSIO 65647 TaxID=2908843 RepID=UPI001F30EF78|nr:T9SS type B sorting domain-containing protein [Muricauda sp. SCSIO 65647]UJH66708.1 T9SS type B sorting domain-containing protein [Muricauda sp. SCSIO 65647]
MRTLFITLCSLFLWIFQVQSQTANSADCRSAIPVCADGMPIMPSVDGGGDIDDFDPDVIRQSGCLEKGSISSANIENNTSWYVFRAGTDGQIGFDIEALTDTAEWDFALYGPFDQTSGQNFCGSISDGSAQPIRCNYEVNTTSFTGVGVNPENGQVGAPFVRGSQNTYDEWLNVIAGEIYYLLINNFNTNFDGNPEPFSLTFTGSSVDADQDTALDCTLRDEFLGLDIIACEGDPDIVLSALNTEFGSDLAQVDWSVDSDGDGILEPLPGAGTGPFGAELVVTSPNSGLYAVTITNSFGQSISDQIQITFYGVPQLDPVNGIMVIDDLVNSNQTDPYNVEFQVSGDGDYEYSLNGGDFQDDPVFRDVPPGLNSIVINDKNGCGTTEPIEFLVVGYPKFFTPNGDGIHDNWQVLGIDQLTDPSIFIFDRFGKLLKELDATTLGWDGTFNGRPMPSSDYWFRLDYDRDDQGVLVARSVRRHFSLVR